MNALDFLLYCFTFLWITVLFVIFPPAILLTLLIPFWHIRRRRARNLQETR